jgi:drug/metabolite transporter (DMT)-like permease
VFLVLCNLFWAGNWVTGRAMRESFGPVALNFWRWLIAALILAPFVLPEVRRQWPVIRREWRILVALSLSGVVLFQSLVYLGLRNTYAINGVLINSTLPVFMIAMAWAFHRDTVTSRQMAGMVLSLAGVVVIVSRGDLSNWNHLSLNLGDFWVLLAMPVWALYSVLLRRRPAELGGMPLVLVLAAMGLPVLGAGYALELLWIPQQAPTLPAIAGVLYIALFASVAAFACWNAAVAALGPNVAGFSIHLLPAFGTVLAILVLGERFEPFHLWGVVGIFAGVALATLKGAGAARPAPKP